MINKLWLFLILIGIFLGLVNGRMEEVSLAIFQAASDTVEILINLLGPMALWLGLMNIAKQAGLSRLLARGIKPFLRYLFPEVPEDHPASGAILLNLTANILGLGNSATPLGIKAMQELQSLNQNKEKASPAMCTLVALNTSSLTIIPTTIISLRAASNSLEPTSILLPTLLATSISTITALLLDKCFRWLQGEV